MNNFHALFRTFREYLKALRDNPAKNNAIIAACPSGSGLELQFAAIIKDKRQYSMVNCETLVNFVPSTPCARTHNVRSTTHKNHTQPWACRIIEYGKTVEVLGTKSSVSIVLETNNFDSVMSTIHKMFPGNPKMLVDKTTHILSPSMIAQLQIKPPKKTTPHNNSQRSEAIRVVVFA